MATAAGGLEEFQHRLVFKREGELARSITTCAPAMASLSPSRLMVLTPLLGEAATTCRGGGRSGRPPPCRAIDRRNRPVARQWLLPRQGRPGDTGRRLPHTP